MYYGKHVQIDEIRNGWVLTVNFGNPEFYETLDEVIQVAKSKLILVHEEKENTF
jgi:hypothetical protein